MKNTLKTVRYMFSFAWKHGKLYLLCRLIEAIVTAFMPVVLVVMPKFILDELMGARNLTNLALYVSALLLATFVQSAVVQLLRTAAYKKISHLYTKFNETLFDHIARMDYEYLEMPAVADMRDRAKRCVSNNGEGFMTIVEQVFRGICGVLSLLTVSTIIFTLTPLLLAVILLMIALNAAFARRVNRAVYRQDAEKVPYERRTGYYMRLLEDFSYGKEIRLYNLRAFILGGYTKNQAVCNGFYNESSAKNSRAGVFSALTNLLQNAVSYALLIYEVVAKGLGIGSFTMYLSAVAMFSSSFSSVVSTWLDISKSGLYVADLIAFMNLPEKAISTGTRRTPAEPGAIEFRNVSFRYPGSDRWALRGVSLTIRRGDKAALVGTNGSGKTTFIKLLLRLYVPTEGTILLDGIDINEYRYDEYLRLFSAVFQDFKLFAASLRENVVFDEGVTSAQYEKAIAESGLEELVSKLTKGGETQITKYFDSDGIEPSGGEGQRLAIARAICHDRPVMILDEPTAALDPLMEYEIFSRFNDMSKGKTTLFVSHRLSSTRFSNVVFVFDGGTIAERGAHDELMERRGLYAEMYDKQSEYYTERSRQ